MLFWILSQILFHSIIQTEIIKLTLFSSKDLYYNPIMHLNEFLIGNLAGLYFISKLKDKKGNYTVQILFTLLILILLLKFPFGLNYHNGLLSIVFIPLILFISLSNSGLTRFLNKNIFVFLGEISFGIYIYCKILFGLCSQSTE
jgi:peptidoglycan/LPS O-acetylase OafA/YrhL